MYTSIDSIGVQQRMITIINNDKFEHSINAYDIRTLRLEKIILVQKKNLPERNAHPVVMSLGGVRANGKQWV